MLYIENSMNFKIEKSVVCLGKFDGLHKGHKKLIDCMKNFAGNDKKTVIFTFANHPTVFIKKNGMKLIDSKKERRKKLINTGADVIIEYPFNQVVASMEPEAFIEEILIKKLDAKCIVVGEDYRFGNHQKGDINLLRKYSIKYGYNMVVIPKLYLYGKPISSSRIRNSINIGDMEVVKELLGESYGINLEIDKVLNDKYNNTIIYSKSISKEKLYPPEGEYLVSLIINKEKYKARAIISNYDIDNIFVEIILNKKVNILKGEAYIEILKSINISGLEDVKAL